MVSTGRIMADELSISLCELEAHPAIEAMTASDLVSEIYEDLRKRLEESNLKRGDGKFSVRSWRWFVGPTWNHLRTALDVAWAKRNAPTPEEKSDPVADRKAYQESLHAEIDAFWSDPAKKAKTQAFVRHLTEIIGKIPDPRARKPRLSGLLKKF